MHGVILDMLIFLATAVLVSPLCRRVRVSPVLGYLLAGSLIGPMGWGLIQDDDGTRDLGELGVVFLLFMIGLELSWERLKIIRHFIFGLGTAQVLVTGALLAAGFALWGHVGGRTAMVIGVALAFSSTAFVLQILTERQELQTQTGRVAVAVLILQDLAVVPLLVLIPLLNGSGHDVAWALELALLKTLFALVTIFAFARFALRPVFHIIADTRAPEVFVAGALLVVIGTSYATGALGLSHSLGAFLAGVMLASSEYRHQVEADLQPFRGLLMGLFFLSVGMTVNPAALLANLPQVLAGVGILVTVKAGVLIVLARLFRFPLSTALHLGLLLAQGGEFAFIVLGQAGQSGLFPPQWAELLTAVVAVSMAVTPLLAVLADRLSQWLRLGESRPLSPVAETDDLIDHVVIVGFGRVGQTVATILREQSIPFVAIDRDPGTVAAVRLGAGMPVYYGDVQKMDVLAAVGIARARALVLTIDSGSRREKLVPRLRQRFPDLCILVRARDRHQAHALELSGATAVVPEILEGSLQLAGKTLRQLGNSPDVVAGLLEQYRADDYARLTPTLGRP